MVLFSGVTTATCTCTASGLQGDAAVDITSGNWFFVLVGTGVNTFGSIPEGTPLDNHSPTAETYLASSTVCGAGGGFGC